MGLLKKYTTDCSNLKRRWKERSDLAFVRVRTLPVTLRMRLMPIGRG